MSKRVKPAIGDGTGALVRADFLPGAFRGTLRRLLVNKGKLEEVDAEAFLERCSAWLQFVLEDGWEIGLGEEKEQLGRVAADARRLLATLTVVSQQTRDRLHLHSEVLKHKDDVPSVPKTVLATIRAPGIDRTIPSLTWDFVQALEVLAELASAGLKPSRQAKPEQFNAASFTGHVIDAFYLQFGELPPSAQESWFVEFMGKFKEKPYGLPCGPVIVRASIKEKRAALSLMATKTGSK
ncbi:hypothetical protein H6CHR_03211 [Variovorax sp. PBL-H6]|uniref:hypothetical protein n=1 Tax=Variovorax sp. PBL-H6 TaxID=434009 RepID=UPI0013160FE6|nr:hypothetical protein [Variovorax sp. PBL-H6]VTU29518.1 hypothetical protein H6CHR_03211 [Variovorax sp. PBL-H6]